MFLTHSIMNHLNNLSMAELVDILSTQTSLLIQMHSQGASQIEFKKCTQLIEQVQEEIKSRKKGKS